MVFLRSRSGSSSGTRLKFRGYSCTKVDMKETISVNDINKIIKIYNFNEKQKLTASKLIQSLYRILIEKDNILQ